MDMQDNRPLEVRIRESIVKGFKETHAELIVKANMPDGDYYALREAWSIYLDGLEKGRQAPSYILHDIDFEESWFT